MFRKIRKKKLSERISDSFKNSLIIHSLTRFSSWIYALCLSGIFGTLMTSYDRVTQSLASSSMVKTIRAFFNNRGMRLIQKAKQSVARSYERSILLTKLRGISYQLLITNISTLGLFLFSFGFYIVTIQLLRQFAFHTNNVETSSALIGLIIMVVAIFMFFSKKNIAEAIYESVVLRTLLFDYLSLRIISVAKAAKTESRRGFNVAFVFGMLFGVISIFVDATTIVLVLAVIMLAGIVLSMPEAGVLLTFLCLPFVTTKHLILMLGLILVSYVLKLLCGRRVLRLSLIDYAVAVFLFFTIFSGIITVDTSSFPKMMVFVIFMLGYFVVKNTISSPSLVRRCLYSLVTSSVLVSAYGLYQNFFGELSTVWQDVTIFSEISGRVVSSFENPNVLGEYLILVFPVTLALMISAKSVNHRFAFFCAAVLNVACLIFTWSRGAWLGFIIATVLFFLLSGKHFFTAGILLTPLAAFGLSFMGNTSVFRRFTTFGDSSTSYRLSIWRGTLDMLKDIWWYGIGIGEGAFRKVYPAYALPGIEAAPHSHNLYLQIITEGGIFALLSFVLFILIFMQCSFSFSRNAVSHANRSICVGLFAGIAAFLIQGLTDYVWYNYRIFLLFWLIAGLSVAHIQAAKQTEEESLPVYY